jgi:hypothetical protein
MTQSGHWIVEKPLKECSTNWFSRERTEQGLAASPQPSLGGLSIWIPPTMMNAMALILVLYALLSQQDRSVPKDVTDGQTGLV